MIEPPNIKHKAYTQHFPICSSSFNQIEQFLCHRPTPTLALDKYKFLIMIIVTNPQRNAWMGICVITWSLS